MHIVLPAFLIGAGISLGAAIQATVIGLVRKRVPVYLLFACACYTVSGVLLSAAAYHRADSIEDAGQALQWLTGCVYLTMPSLFAFISLYTGQKRPRGLTIVTIVFGAMAIANAFTPYSLRFSSLEKQQPLRMPWGEQLSLFAGETTPWSAVSRVLLVALFSWAVWRAGVQFRSGQRRRATLLVGYLAVQIVGVVWGGLIDAGVLRSVYAGSLAFLLLVLFMSVSMGIDLRDQNLQITRLVVEWRETFDSVRTPILVTDASGKVLRANQAACELSSLGNAPILGKPIADLGDGEPWQTAAQLVRHMAERHGPASTETKDDRDRTWDLNIALFSSADDEMERYILVFWDITGIVELQEALRRNETMLSMGTLVAGVAHEVRNPLFGISATLDAYAEELQKPEYAPCAAALRVEVERLKHLMQELLDYGKPGMLTIEKGSVAEVVQQAIEGRGNRESSVQVVSSVPESLPPMLMDRARMQQVFENLLDNAAQHSPPDGVVSAYASLVEDAGREWIECTVEDNGPGFAPEDIDRAFEPFFTKRPGGTGLGLSIVQRIVEEHSGKVFAGNGPGGGAMIRVRLPVAET